GQDQGDRDRSRVGLDADRLQHRVDQTGDRGLRDRTEYQRGGGDAELGTREFERQIAKATEEALGSPVPFLRQGFHSAAVDRDVGELLGHEEPIDDDQDEDNRQAQPGIYLGTSGVTAGRD